MYFFGDRLDAPKIKDVFHIWSVDGLDYYVLHGIDKNYTYVYEKAAIKYMVSGRVPTLRKNEYDVTIDKRNDTNGNVNHGDHLTIQVMRKSGTTCINSHWTEYLDDGFFNFTRIPTASCFFELVGNVKNIKDFTDRTNCIDKHGATVATIDKRYNRDDDIKIIYRMSLVIANGKNAAGGGQNPNCKRYVYHNNHKYLLRKSRTGRMFIRTSKSVKKNIYIQKGGSVGYKGITFINETFVSYLSEKVFTPVSMLREGLVSTQLMFDELNELSPTGNKHIVVLYDFESGIRNIFLIDFTLACVSCYATIQIKSGNAVILTEYEKHCLERFEERYKTPQIPVHQF